MPTIKIIYKCNDCGHYDNAENFIRFFGLKCPNCKSKNIEENWHPPKPKTHPPADGVKTKSNTKLWLVFDRFPQSPEQGVFIFNSKLKAKKFIKDMNEDVEEERDYYNLHEGEYQFYGPFLYNRSIDD